MYLCVLYVLYMSSWVSIKMSHVYVKGFLIQSKFVASSSQIFFQSFFVESKFLKCCIVTQIGASFDHFPYFSDLTEYRFCFVLVSYEIKHVSHDGRNSCHLELLLAHCGWCLKACVEQARAVAQSYCSYRKVENKLVGNHIGPTWPSPS